MANPKGVDQSHHNVNVQYGTMKQDGGISFVGLKVTEGAGNIDPTFADRRPRAHRVGFGAYMLYHFFHPLESPVAQAIHYCKQIGKRQLGEFICVDLESTPGWDKLSPKESADAVIAWIVAVKSETGALDRNFMIYGSMGWLRGQFGDQLVRLTPWLLWLAGGPVYNEKNPPAPDHCSVDVSPWKSPAVFQYNQFGSVPGAGSGDVDMNVWIGPIPEAA